MVQQVKSFGDFVRELYGEDMTIGGPGNLAGLDGDPPVMPRNQPPAMFRRKLPPGRRLPRLRIEAWKEDINEAKDDANEVYNQYKKD